MSYVIKKGQLKFKDFLNYKANSYGVDELKYNLKILSKDKQDFFSCKYNNHLSEWIINESQKDILKIE